MAWNRRGILIRERITKFFLISILIISLLAISFNLQHTIFELNSGIAKAETGAPPINGSTAQPWIIESFDNIPRSNENISTQNITINSQGIMTWVNVTANISGDILIEPDSIFNLADSNLTLTGNLTIRGHMNVINTTILFNCSTMGQFLIAVEGGMFNLREESNITSSGNDKRLRVLYVDQASKIYIENSSLSFIGWNSKRPGVLIDINDVVIRNSSFSYSYNAISISYRSNGIIENCKFFRCHYGLNLSNSSGYLIENCEFRNNYCGIFGEFSNSNQIIDSEFINNDLLGIKLITSSSNNIQNCLLYDKAGGISIENNSQDNNISYCIIQNGNQVGVTYRDNSNDGLINNCVFDNIEYGFICKNNSKRIKLINCSFFNIVVDDLTVVHASEVTTLNSSFDNNSLHVETDSNLTVQWFLHIRVLNSTLAPISKVNISIHDNKNGNFEYNTTTDMSGSVSWVTLTEFFELETGRTYFTPHTIKARKYGYNKNESEIIIDSSKVINLTLNQTVPFLPDLTPILLTFSNDYPLYNQSILITSKIANYGLLEFNSSLFNVTTAFYVDNFLINTTTNISSIPIDSSTEIATDWRVNVTNGTHNITIIIDHHGNLTELNSTNNSITKEIIVNSIPIAKLKIEPNQTFTFTNILFNASESFNEVDEVGIQFYYYDFGDGMVSDWVDTGVGYHNYSDNGTYYAKVQVMDISGQISAWSEELKIEILNRPPIANFSIEPSTGTVETEFRFNPSLASDLDGNVTSYLWDFSDGTNSKNQTPRHKFGDDIEYTILLTVWDNDGAQSEVYSKKFKIQNTPPIAKFKILPENTNFSASDDITFDATETLDPDDELYTLDYTWDFGDDTYGYNSSIITHNFSKPGTYNVTLYVQDDDSAIGETWMLINIMKSPPQKNGGLSDMDILWVVILVVIVLIIFFILIMLVFITQSKKLRKQIEESKEGDEMDKEPSEFTTAGKLDFIILKKPRVRRYLKFELHDTTKSPGEFIGLVWKSALLDSSWNLMEKELGSKEQVIDYLQLKILGYNNKNWAIDYGGNGTILSKPKSGVPITSITSQFKESEDTEIDSDQNNEPETNL